MAEKVKPGSLENIVRQFTDVYINTFTREIRSNNQNIVNTKCKLALIRYGIACRQLNQRHSGYVKVPKVKRKPVFSAEGNKKKPKYIPPIKNNNPEVYSTSCNIRGEDKRTKLVRLKIGAIIRPLSLKNVPCQLLDEDETQILLRGSSHMWKLYFCPIEGIENAFDYIEKVVICVDPSYGQQVNEVVVNERVKKNGIVIQHFGSISFTMKSNIHFKNPSFNRPVEYIHRLDLVVDEITGFEENLNVQILALDVCDEFSLRYSVSNVAGLFPVSCSESNKDEVTSLLSNEPGISKISDKDFEKSDSDSKVSVLYNQMLSKPFNSQVRWRSILKKNDKQNFKQPSQTIKFIKKLQCLNVITKNNSAKTSCELFIYNLMRELLRKKILSDEFHVPMRKLCYANCGQISTLQMQCAVFVRTIVELNKNFILPSIWSVSTVLEYLKDHGFIKHYLKVRRINYTKPITSLPNSTISFPNSNLTSFITNTLTEDKSEEENNHDYVVCYDLTSDYYSVPKSASRRIGDDGNESLIYSKLYTNKHKFPLVETHLIDWLLQVVRLIGISIMYDYNNFVPQLLESIFNSFAEYLLRKCLSVINSKGKRRVNCLKKKDVLLAIIRTERLHFLTEEGFGKPLDINSLHYKY